MVTCTGDIGIHEGAEGRMDVHDIMAIKPNFLTSMGYHIFLTMVLCAQGGGLKNNSLYTLSPVDDVKTGFSWGRGGGGG